MIFLSLGSNLGDRAENLRVARELLAEELNVSLIGSCLLETEAIGFTGPAFLNQVVGFGAAGYLSGDRGKTGPSAPRTGV